MNGIVDLGMVTKISGFTSEISVYSARITFSCFHVCEQFHSTNKKAKQT